MLTHLTNELFFSAERVACNNRINRSSPFQATLTLQLADMNRLCKRLILIEFLLFMNFHDRFTMQKEEWKESLVVKDL